MTAAEIYAARIDAIRAQRARLHGALPASDPWGGLAARRFRADPHRPLDANLAVLASYTRPEDVLLDVGGGAGRVALPLALRCREVITVDASPGMGAEFAAAVTEAGITNARFVHANWLEAEGLQGDVALTANVTYFGQWLGLHDHARARRLIEERFAELFAPSPAGFRPLWREEAREVLITWETKQK
jgi:SAM-dependent methyltransferase